MIIATKAKHMANQYLRDTYPCVKEHTDLIDMDIEVIAKKGEFGAIINLTHMASLEFAAIVFHYRNCGFSCSVNGDSLVIDWS